MALVDSHIMLKVVLFSVILILKIKKNVLIIF